MLREIFGLIGEIFVLTSCVAILVISMMFCGAAAYMATQDNHYPSTAHVAR